jgi:PIN domain nuclease of toxin-antitoxin system
MASSFAATARGGQEFLSVMAGVTIDSADKPTDNQDRLHLAKTQLLPIHGLSLGDRTCIALGLQQGLPVLTADLKWTEVNVGVQIEVIR